MSESLMREALLEQIADPGSQPGLKMLADVVESENRRARRLTRWTLGVWAAWVIVILLALVGWAVVGALSYGEPNPYMRVSSFDHLLWAVVSTVALAGALAAAVLPVVGIVLLVLAGLARRSATLTQVRSSLALIELQLKQLSAAQNAAPNTGPNTAPNTVPMDRPVPPPASPG